MNSFKRLAQALSELGKVTEKCGSPVIIDGQAQNTIKILEDKHMRILKGWPSEERKELEEAKDEYFYSAIDLIRGIFEGDDHCIALMEKKVTVTKAQIIASLVLASKAATNGFQDVLKELTKEIGPKLPDDFKANITLTDYEEAKYTGD